MRTGDALHLRPRAVHQGWLRSRRRVLQEAGQVRGVRRQRLDLPENIRLAQPIQVRGCRDGLGGGGGGEKPASPLILLFSFVFYCRRAMLGILGLFLCDVKALLLSVRKASHLIATPWARGALGSPSVPLTRARSHANTLGRVALQQPGLLPKLGSLR